jgi:hypothetical protein
MERDTRITYKHGDTTIASNTTGDGWKFVFTNLKGQGKLYFSPSLDEAKAKIDELVKAYLQEAAGEK